MHAYAYIPILFGSKVAEGYMMPLNERGEEALMPHKEEIGDRERKKEKKAIRTTN